MYHGSWFYTELAKQLNYIFSGFRFKLAFQDIIKDFQIWLHARSRVKISFFAFTNLQSNISSALNACNYYKFYVFIDTSKYYLFFIHFTVCGDVYLLPTLANYRVA